MIVYLFFSREQTQEGRTGRTDVSGNSNAGQDGGHADTTGAYSVIIILSTVLFPSSHFCYLFFPRTTKTGGTGRDGTGRDDAGGDSNTERDHKQAGGGRR